MKRNFRLPGPIELHDEVYARLGEPMMNHRGPEYAELLERITRRLKIVFRTHDDVLMLNCSGTGALESVVANLFSRRDSILVHHADGSKGAFVSVRWTRRQRGHVEMI